MNEYFAASHLRLGSWNHTEWSDNFTAALSLGELSDEEAVILRNAIEGDSPEEYRDVYIVSNESGASPLLRAKVLSKCFFQNVYQHLKDLELSGVELSTTDYPPYFQPIKTAYEAACMVQAPQRLPDFDTLFQGPTAPSLPFKISQPDSNGILRVIVAGYEDQALQQWNNGNIETEMEWVHVSDAASRLGKKDGRLPYKLDTMSGWRSGGDQPTETEPGLDSKGNVWRYSIAGNFTEYYLPRIDQG